jgi:hypothetical protein
MEILLFLFTRAVLFYCIVVLIYTAVNLVEDAEFDGWD